MQEELKTNILDAPENKQDKIFYYLYDNEKETAEKLTEVGELENKDAFYKLRSRQKENIKTIEVINKIKYFGLSETQREKITILIEQQKKKLEYKEILKNETEKISNEKEELISSIKNFLESYKKELTSNKKQGVIFLDFQKINEFSPELSDKLIKSPEETLRYFEIAVEEAFLLENIKIRIKNLSKIHERKIEDLRAEDIDEFKTLRGRVMQQTDVKSQCVNAKFECPSCGTVISVLQMEKKFREPSRCSCGRRGGFKLISKEMRNISKFVLEELYEKSNSPLSKRLNCFISDDLVNEENIKKAFPGNEVLITGILKEIPTPLKSGGISTLFEKVFEVNHLEMSEDDINIDNFSDEEVKKIKELSKNIDDNGLGILRDSFAPDVHGHESIKDAIIFFLSNKKNNKKTSVVRNKLNILLMGDPGTAKSVLGNRAVSITPHSKKQTGGSASAVGLTASVLRDDFTGGWAIQPGACVLAKEFIFIDELNNLGDDEKPKLQEAMSEQEINIAKASIQATLPVTGGFLACANPIHGIFKEDISLVKQFNIPSPILNRFDLTFIIKDEVISEEDKKISESMIKRHRKTLTKNFDDDFLKKFFFYIRNFQEPTFEDKIEKKLINLYGIIRKKKNEDNYINARINESLIKMLIASAKLRLSEKVEEKDIERSINILSASYLKISKYKILNDELKTLSGEE